MSQPAASMRLRALERTLGVQLLERSASGARLTSAGQAVSTWARPALEAVETLLSGAAALRAVPRRPLAVAASLTVAEYLMPRWIRVASASTPGFGVALTMGNSSQVVELVRRGDVELGYIEGPTRTGNLREAIVGEDELVVVVAPSHPWARLRRPLAPKALASTPLVLREPGSGTREVLALGLAALGLEATPLVELGSTTAIKGAVAAGIGPAALGALAVAEDLREGRLVAVRVSGLDLRRSMRALWRANRKLSPAGRALLAAGGIVSEPARVPDRA